MQRSQTNEGVLPVIRRFWVAVVFLVLLAVFATPRYAYLSGSVNRVYLVDDNLPLMVKSGFNGGNDGFGGSYVSGEVLVKFVSDASESVIGNLRSGQGVEELYASPLSSVRRWRVPPSRTVQDWVNFLNGHPLVEYAELNYIRHAFVFPNDPLYIYQWNFDDDHTFNEGGASSNPYGGVNGGGIGMEDAWEITNGSSSVVVAVLDTGVAYENYAIPSYERNPYIEEGVSSYQISPDLAGTSFWVNEDEIAGNGLDDDANGYVDDVNGWDFINNDAHPNDNSFHGTHVTGTIAQTTDNGYGAAGIAFHTTIMPVKVLDYKGDCTDSSVADGIYCAVNNGAKIINLSFGSPDPSITLEDAVAYAFNTGVVVVASSGNEGMGSVSYPAAYDEVIAVGATRYDETRPSYSNYGSSLDLVAPGGDKDVNQNGDEYVDGIVQMTFKPYQGVHSKADPTVWHYYLLDGTSMSAPHVSGVAALILSQEPTLTPSQVRNVLESTAEDKGDPGRDDIYGWGLIDAKAALQSITGSARLVLSVTPFQNAYSGGQLLTLTIMVFNELNPPLNSTLTLTVTSPDGYYTYDFQPIEIEADEIKTYSFNWTVPDTAGTYRVEVGLVPEQITAYDVVWLEVKSSSTGFLRGTITDFDTDIPIMAIEILVDGSYVVNTNATGQYSLELPQGEYEITAFESESSFYETETASVTIVAGTVTTQDFQLKRNSWVLFIETSGSGETNPAPGEYARPRDTKFTVRALPDKNWKLLYWLLDSVDVGSENPIQFFMDTNHYLTAVFSEVSQTSWLRGTVIDAETNAPIEGAKVSVGSYSNFTDATGYYEMEIQAGSYMVTVDEMFHSGQGVWITMVADSVTVKDFILDRSHWMLTVEIEGSGSANLTQGVHAFSIDSKVVVEAFPEASSELSQWILDSVNVGSENPLNVSMNANHVLRAVFVEAPTILEFLSPFTISILLVILMLAGLIFFAIYKKQR